MEYTCRILDQVSAVWIQLGQSRTEMVVNRSTFEYALLTSFPLSPLEIFNLQDDGQVFHQKYAT